MKFFALILKYIGFLLASLLAFLLVLTFILYINKDKLWENAKLQLTTSLKSRIEVSSIGLSFPNHFPNLSLRVKELRVIDSISQSQVLHIQNLKADIDLLSIVTFKPKIYSLLVENAKLDLKADAKGIFNFSILNIPDQDSTNSTEVQKSTNLHFNIPFQKIALKNVSVQFFDTSNYQHYDLKIMESTVLVNQKNKDTKLSFEGKVFCQKLGINTLYGTFLKNKMVESHFFATIPSDQEQIVFQPSYIVIDSERYEVKGFFKPAKHPDLNIIISTETAVVTKVLESISELVAAQIAPFQVSNTVHAVITIAGPIMPNQDPKIDLLFWSSDNTFKYKDVPIEVKHIDFKGIVCNHLDPNKPPGDPNTNFEIKDVKGKIGFSDLQAHVNAYNLVNPQVKVNATIELNLALLNDSMPALPLDDLKGKVKLAFDYKGTLPAGNEISLMSKWKYEGDLTFDNIAFKKGGIQYKNIVGKMKIKNDIVNLPKGFGFNIGGNQVYVSGFLAKPIQHFLIPDTLLKANLTFTSPYFNINTLMVKSQKNKRTLSRKIVAEKINAGLQNLQFVIALDFKKALFRKLQIENLKGEFYRYNDILKLNALKMNTSGGSMQVDMEANNLDSETQNGSAEVLINNLDVKKLFYGMNNFDQSTVEHRHLNGKFNAKITFSTSFTDGYSIIPSSMKGKLKFDLTHGHLIDFEPLQGISKFIFLRRDFSDISFAKLTQTAVLNGKTLTISEMKIQSNILTLFVDGTYNFDNKVDLNIRIPWLNLKSNAHYLEAIKKDQTNAKALHIRAFTKDGKLTFGLGK